VGLGRRMDKLLVERSLYFWTHIVLGFLSGSACVGAAIISLGSQFPRGGALFTRGGGGASVAIVFVLAALPYVVSYRRNINREAATTARAVVFFVGLVGISIVVNVAVVWILLTHYSALAFWLIYSTQTGAYLFIGNLLLEPGPDNDGFDW
jgi:hypothetical protein